MLRPQPGQGLRLPGTHGIKVHLTTCWKCNQRDTVAASDMLGLCRGCKDLLRDPDYLAEHVSSENVDAQRAAP